MAKHGITVISGLAKGTNGLLRDGAMLYLKPAQLLFDNCSTGSEAGFDFLNHLEIIKKSEKIIKGYSLNKNLTLAEQQIQAILRDSDKTIQELENLTGISQVLLMEHLSIMELEGLIVSSTGGRFRIK